MQITVADYIVSFLASKGVDTAFSVTGGASMYITQSLKNNPDISLIFNHHEQASSIAAEAYARFSNKPALVSVSSGPGAVNALTGCLCSWMGSTPLIILSGQVRLKYTSSQSHLALRSYGEQEINIIKICENMCKYSRLITDVADVKEIVLTAYYEACEGRPGPVWLDVPLDLQSQILPNTYDVHHQLNSTSSFSPQDNPDFSELLSLIRSSKRPLILAGFGVRLSGALPCLQKFLQRSELPVVTSMSSVDFFDYTDPNYIGFTGSTGTRAANLALQTCDLLICIGSRLSLKVTGYNTENWAPKATIVQCDVDNAELLKNIEIVDFFYNCTALSFVDYLNSILPKFSISRTVLTWKSKLNLLKERFKEEDSLPGFVHHDAISIYSFYNLLSELAPSNTIYISSAGTTRVVAHQSLKFRGSQRLITNPPTAPMGYCLPAILGVQQALSSPRPIICITGEGSFQMNLQELQTLKTNNVKCIIVIVNNSGYHAIRLTQSSFFPDQDHIGIGPESNDLEFPSHLNLANAYQIPYFSCNEFSKLRPLLQKILVLDKLVIFEVFTSKEDVIIPKSSSRIDETGAFISTEIHDMKPFIPEEALSKLISDLIN